MWTNLYTDKHNSSNTTYGVFITGLQVCMCTCTSYTPACITLTDNVYVYFYELYAVIYSVH